MRVCIVGGGSLGHVCAAFFSSRGGADVNVFTQRPEAWSHTLTIEDCDGRVMTGQLGVVSSRPDEALNGCDLILLCLPGFAIERTLQKIAPYIGQAVVGSIVSSTGFFFMAHKVLGTKARLFGFQRVPFIARTVEYGRSARLLGYKSQLAIATENLADAEAFRAQVETLCQTPTQLLSHYLEVALTNSNPILHTGRLYTMWSGWSGATVPECLLFYEGWTDAASELLIAMDHEFFLLLEKLGLADKSIQPLLTYYESHDASSLTRKIQSIKAFKGITAPMRQTPDGWVPDFGSRYFTEDFPFGLRFIVDLAHEHHVDIPNMERVLAWGLSVMQP